MAAARLLPLGLALMRVGWVYPWLLLVGLWTRGEPAALLPAPALLLLAALPRPVVAGLARLGWPLAAVRLAALAGGAAAAAAAVWLEHGSAGVPALLADPFVPVLALVAGLLLWRQGLLDSQTPVEHDDLSRALTRGVGALIGCLLLGSLAGGRSLAVLHAEATGYVIGFFGVALSALALARLESFRRRPTAGTAAAAPGREWLGLVAATVLGLLVLALAGAQLLSFDLLSALLRPLVWLLVLLLTAFLMVVGLPLALLLDLIVSLVRSWLPRLEPRPREESGGARLADLLRDLGPGRPVPPELLLLAQWLAIGLVVAAVLFLIARAVAARRERRSEDGVEEERDSVWSWAIVLAALRGWLSARRRRRAGQPSDPPRAAGGAAADAGGPDTIRRIYRDLLRLGAARGAPRPPSATPREHLPRLQDALGPDDTLAAVTDAYARARYGLEPPPESELEPLRRWWSERSRPDPDP